MLSNDLNKVNLFKRLMNKLYSKQNPLISKLAGPLMALVLVMLLIVLRFYGHEVPNLMGVYAAIIIYAVFTEGYVIGAVTAFIAIAYTGYHAYVHDFGNYKHVYEFLIHPINILIFLGIAVMTGIKRKEVSQYLKDLKSSEGKYKALFNNAYDMVFLVEILEDSTFSKFIEVNDAACEKLGYSKIELLDMTPLDLTIKEQHDITISIFSELIHKGKLRYERKLITKEGMILQIEFSSTCLIQDKRNLIIAIARDVTERRGLENKLKESEEFNRKLIELSPDGIFIHEDGRLVYANPALLKIVKATSLDQILGKQIIDFVHPEYHDLVKGRIDEVLNNSSDIPMIEEKLIAIDGTTVMIETAGTPLVYPHKRMVYGIIRDITNRKHDEERLLESEKKFRMLFNSVNDAIFVHELTDIIIGDKFMEVNDSACKMLGFSKDEFLQLSPNMITEPSSLKKVDLDILLSNGRNTFECNLKTKAGELINVEISSKIIELNNKQLALSVVRNMTEKKQIEIKLSQSRERYEKLVELIPSAIFVHRDGRYVYANAAGINLLRASCIDDIIGKEIIDFIHKDYLGIINKNLKDIDEYATYEIKHLRFDGSIVDAEISSIPIQSEDGTSIMSVVRDISERKRTIALQRDIDEKNRILDETMELDKIRTEFFANISHELRTPLTLIHTTMQVFKKSFETKLAANSGISFERYFDIVRQNTFRLLRLINNLIDITKMDAGFMDYNPGNYNIVSLVEDIVLSVSGFVAGKGISIQFDTDVEEKMVKCDPDKIERIMLNLISNSVKFTDEGGNIIININDESDRIIISVKDTGIGIEKEKQDLVFDRFRQVDKSFRRNHEGSGIGLSIVKSMVEMHGGRIRLESEPSKGSKFIIELPSVRYENTRADYINENTVQSRRKIDIIDIEFSDIYK